MEQCDSITTCLIKYVAWNFFWQPWPLFRSGPNRLLHYIVFNSIHQILFLTENRINCFFHSDKRFFSTIKWHNSYGLYFLVLSPVGKFCRLFVCVGERLKDDTLINPKNCRPTWSYKAKIHRENFGWSNELLIHEFTSQW